MIDPTVSVILPVYNGENYVRLAIESVLGQTLRDYELLVVDDGSTDSTPAIVQDYGERVRYVRQQNTGVAGAFNHGLRLAKGRYISWLSHDDMFLPEKLEEQVAALDRLPGPAVCYTDVEIINASGEFVTQMRLPEYPRGEAVRHILTSGEIGMASYSICYDRRCIEKVGYYAEHLRYAQDAEMLVRLSRHFPLVRIPKVLTRMRESVRTSKWEREVLQFYRHQLSSIPLAEMFPEVGDTPTAGERSRAFFSIGDTFAGLPHPLYHVAYSQYRRAFRENPADAVRSLRRIVGLYLRRWGEQRAL